MSDIVGLVQADILQCGLLVLEAWFTGLSSTGSRRASPYGANLTCAAPATVSRRAFAPLSSNATERPETGAWEGDEGCSA
jgi:hypothetical protein